MDKSRFCTDQPIDMKHALETMGGEKSMFFRILKMFPTSLTKSMEDIAQAMDSKDYNKYKLAAHTLKGSSSYIGAGCLFQCCYEILEA